MKAFLGHRCRDGVRSEAVPGNGRPAEGTRRARERLGGTQWSLLLAFSISDLRDPSPSQILGTSSRFSEDCLGRERDP